MTQPTDTSTHILGMRKTDVSPPFDDPNVERVFEAYPAETKAGLLQLRALIFDVAARTDGVGRIEETIKWGQPAYLTPDTKSGSTLRLGRPKSGGFAIYAHCQTSIISDFKAIFPKDFVYEGNRALLFSDAKDLRQDQLSLLIQSALTYHCK